MLKGLRKPALVLAGGVALMCLNAGGALAQVIHPTVPEIDPASAVGALALVVGVLALMSERFRRTRQAD